MLISHIFKHHPTANKREFSSLSETIEHEEQNWLCPYCNRKYLSSGKRREHIKKSHPGKEIPPSIKKAGRGEANVKLVKTIKRSPNECPYCPMEYSHRTKLLKHCKGADWKSIFFNFKSFALLLLLKFSKDCVPQLSKQQNLFEAIFSIWDWFFFVA